MKRHISERVKFGPLFGGWMSACAAACLLLYACHQPAEQAAAPATSCELDLIEARDAIGDLLQERDDLRERLAAAEGRP